MTKWLKLANGLRITGCLKIGMVLMAPVSFGFLLIPAAANPCWPSTDIARLCVPLVSNRPFPTFSSGMATRDQMTARNAGCAILRWIFLPQPHLPRDSNLDQFAADGEKLTQSFGDLWSIFAVTTADLSMGQIICSLNALDKCQIDERGGLMEAVMRFHQGGVRNGNVRFLVTGRP